MSTPLRDAYEKLGHRIPDGYTVLALDWNTENASEENLVCVPVRLANTIRKNEAYYHNAYDGPEYLRAVIQRYEIMRTARKHYDAQLDSLPQLTAHRIFNFNNTCKVIEMTNGEVYLYDDILEQVLAYKLKITNAGATHLGWQRAPWLVFSNLQWENITIDPSKPYRRISDVEGKLIARYYPIFSTRILNYLTWLKISSLYSYVSAHNITTVNRRPSSLKWSEEEIEILKNLYPTYGPNIAPLLNNRSKLAIKWQANSLHLTKADHMGKMYQKLPENLLP